jgi:hypothetical protein
MTIVVVAEKPSVARDIARVLGARRKAEGHLEGNDYCVTWALGHLVRFAEPDNYGPHWSGRWATDQLPMIPEQWRLKTERSTAKQFQLVKRLINDAATEEVACATDAGREGENIFRKGAQGGIRLRGRAATTRGTRQRRGAGPCRTDDKGTPGAGRRAARTGTAHLPQVRSGAHHRGQAGLRL